MLLDSYLTQQCTDEYFRMYQWLNPTISLGTTNNINEINLNYINEHNINIVRRETGGGIVFHNEDLCFSFITNYKLKPKENYYLIKTTIEKILLELGQTITTTHDTNIKSSICFNGSNNHEISIDNKKVIGIAQKLVNNRYLIQGSIQLKTITIQHLISDSDSDRKVMQYGINNIKLSTIQDKIYQNFAKMFSLVEVQETNILNKKEYIKFKQENKDRFYGDN
jgi:lipoate-protein ligase A